MRYNVERSSESTKLPNALSTLGRFSEWLFSSSCPWPAGPNMATQLWRTWLKSLESGRARGHSTEHSLAWSASRLSNRSQPTDRRRPYRLTPAGIQALEQELTQLQSLAAVGLRRLAATT